MIKPNTTPNDGETLQVRRGRVESIDLYEVKEDELDLLEKGSQATLQLNFSIFLFSIAFTSIAALATSDFKWKIIESVFTFVSLIGIILGAYYIISWRRTKTSITGVISTIRNRINEAPIQGQTPEKPETQPKKPENDKTPYG